METHAVSWKKVFKMAGAFCAYWIGAGFATGQDILQFLATHGVAKGIAGAVIYSLLLGCMVYILYGIGQKMQFKNPYEVYEYYCGKYIGRSYGWFNIVLLYGFYVLMLAGAGAVFEQYYGISAATGMYCVALLALVTVLVGVEKLLTIIGFIGPFNIVFLTAICIAALVVLMKQPDLLVVNSDIIQNGGFPTISDNWLWSAILWAFTGLMFGGTFFVISGSACQSAKEAQLSGLLGVGAVFIVIFLVTIAEVVYVDVIRGQQVPTLAIANHVAPVLAMVFAPILVVCIYSPVASILLVVTRKFAVDKTKKFNMIAICLTAMGMFAATLLSFEQFVNIISTLSGYIGMILAACMMYKGFVNKWCNNHKWQRRSV